MCTRQLKLAGARPPAVKMKPLQFVISSNFSHNQTLYKLQFFNMK